MMTLANPIWLLLLLLVPLVWYLPERRGERAMIRFPSSELYAGIRPTLWQRLAWLPRALRALCLTLLIVALARPQRPNEKTRVYAEGIAIQMVVDSSGSMQVTDFALDRELVTRLDAVKHVFARFVRGDDRLRGRPEDLIGLVTFADFPDVKCPLTLSHEVLLREIDLLAIAADRGTNIGDAVAWALEDLRTAKAKSKVMILLTDGVNSPTVFADLPRPLHPVEAARVAQGLGVRIYTIGVGSTSMEVRFPLDERLLTSMAEITGGKYFRATDTDALRHTYRAIDELEKTRSENVVYLDYKALFPTLAWTALAVLCIEQLLVATRLRRIP